MPSSLIPPSKDDIYHKTDNLTSPFISIHAEDKEELKALYKSIIYRMLVEWDRRNYNEQCCKHDR